MTEYLESWLDVSQVDDWRDADLATVRAGDVEREINDDPASITIQRAGSTLAAQTVRLVQPGRGRADDSPGGEAGVAGLIVLGTASFDVQFGDRFLADGQLYRVVYVAPAQSGRVEAAAVQVQ